MMGTILVIDDDRAIRDLIALKLGLAGHDVHTSPDGEAGLEQADAVGPDVVVVDWMMPKINGLEFCRLLRRDPAHSDARIIMLTAKAQEHDHAEGVAAGADVFLTKPFSPRQLTTVVESMLVAPGSK